MKTAITILIEGIKRGSRKNQRLSSTGAPTKLKSLKDVLICYV
jgi:hypothetical protein